MLPCACVRKYVVNGNSNELEGKLDTVAYGNSNEFEGKLDTVACRMVDIFKCHTSHPIFPATEPLSLGRLRIGGRNYHFLGTDGNKKVFIGMRLKTQVPSMRRSEHDEEIDLEQLTFISKKTANNATSSRLVATSHCESRDADSESFRTGNICQNGGKWTVSHYS